jgi:dTDP-4-amino-4,6-dideoxygalactose transaminase
VTFEIEVREPLQRESDLYSKFCNHDTNDLSETEYIANGILSLPIYESLPDETVSAVAEVIQHIVRSARERKAS